MSEMLQFMKDIERQISTEKGPFTLFALFQRQDLPTRWDLVVSAPWVEDDNESALRFFAVEMKKRLPTTDFERVSRIVFLDPADDRVKALGAQYDVEHERIEIEEGSQFGFPAEHGYIITARPAA